jgi:hypothetical protein
MRPIADLMASLSELTEGAVRGIRKTAEDPPRVSVLDVIGAITGLDSNNSSNYYHRLTEQFPEVSRFCSNFKFNGRGQRDTPVTCAKGVVTIVMLLPGRAAAHVRKRAASTLVRFLGGDMSMVEELARNHLTQQELDEDDPGRIFGKAVESDAIKRKREEVDLATLEVQLAEQEGARKRRRIESIQFCLESLESVGGADDRDRLRATDMVRTVAFGSASSTEQPTDREICVRQVINETGRAREVGLDCKVGKLAKKLYITDHPGFQFPKKSIYANGQLIEANMWLASQRPYIDRALASL